jgi:hypothetical protein
MQAHNRRDNQAEQKDSWSNIDDRIYGVVGS